MSDYSIVQFDYRNHKGREGLRRVRPIRLYFGSSCYYPVAQWLLEAFDLDKQETRDFAMAKIRNWRTWTGYPNNPAGEFDKQRNLDIQKIANVAKGAQPTG